MLTPNWYPGPRQLRQFAVFSLFGFALFGLMIFRAGGSQTAAMTVGAIGIAAFVIGLPLPGVLRPLYWLMMLVAVPIGHVLSLALLGFIYFGVFTPIGLVFRVMRRDALTLKRPTGKKSYWREYRQPTRASDYYRQA
jgi:saxitoxin biosynthesis operon SxtJ-like protein